MFELNVTAIQELLWNSNLHTSIMMADVGTT